MAHQYHLADLFEAVAATVPERVAVQSNRLTLTFAELDARATRLASGLAAQGIGRGDTVGLYLTNCAEHLEAYVALFKLGAVPFNVNFRYGVEELAYLFDNARSLYHRRSAHAHRAQEGQPGGRSPRRPWRASDQGADRPHRD
jgi:fatty-acyl-CoA synthase